MKTSKAESRLIRIIKSSNPVISMDYLKGFKQAVKPVNVNQLTLAKKISIPIVEAKLQHQKRFTSHLI